MSTIARVLLAFALTLSTLSVAHARTPVPIVNHENVIWARPDGKALEVNEVKSRIIKAGQEKSWSIVPGSAENSLIGTLVVRGKHTVRVSIVYGASTFSVKYLDSINMNYKAPEAGSTEAQTAPLGVVHPFYNRWAEELVTSIRNQLQM